MNEDIIKASSSSLVDCQVDCFTVSHIKLKTSNKISTAISIEQHLIYIDLTFKKKISRITSSSYSKQNQ